MARRLTSRRDMTVYDIDQLRVIMDHIVYYFLPVGMLSDLLEEFARTFNLRVFFAAQLQRSHRAFGLGDKIKMLKKTSLSRNLGAPHTPDQFAQKIKRLDRGHRVGVKVLKALQGSLLGRAERRHA